MSDDAEDLARLPPMELRRRAGIERKTFKKGEGGVLAQTLIGALKIRTQMVKDGATRADADKYLEGVLRASWPQARREPWHYYCERCNDTGLEMLQCTPRHRCSGISTRVDHWRDKPGKYQKLCIRDANYAHDYGVPCICSRGERFRDNPRSSGVSDADLGKSRRPSRFGE